MLWSQGVRVGRLDIPWRDVAGVAVERDAIAIARHSTLQVVRIPMGRTPLSAHGAREADVEQLQAQLLSATQRARGDGPEKPVAATRIDVLARGNAAREEWLARLDAAAAGFATGYRGPGLEQEDLWSTLHDPEAPADVRAGAARVLLRVAPEKARVDVPAVLATVRVKDEEELIRDAIDDLEDEPLARRRA
jgi:hypothetical protein